MTVPRRFIVLDTLRRKLLRGEVAEMSHADILEARGPHIEGRLGQAVVGAVTGRPRADVARTTLFVPGAASELPARLHRPAVVAPEQPLVLHLHGGGWVVGGPVQYDWFCGELAAALGALVLSVDYRKAPEHPAPAAAQDCAAVARWLLAEGGAAEIGAPGPLVVAGDSAGGNLAALTAIAVRDAGLDGLAAQLLVYPGTDLTLSSRSATAQTEEPILTRTDMEAFVDMYLADGMAADDPRVSPLHTEELGGLAPACIQTAEHDPLRDEGRAYADALASAGVQVRHTEYARMPHGFVSLPGLAPAARQAVAELVQFTRPLIT